MAKKDKTPTLADQMEIVDEWWREVDPQMKLEAPIGDVAELFVKKGLAQDEDFAKKMLQKNMQNKAKMVTVEDFNQIFCKNIFKDALIAITTKIEKANEGISEMPLTLKLGKYQRELIEPGLVKTNDDKMKDARAIMNALFALQCEEDPSILEQTYGEFIQDPLGHVAKKRAEELAKMKIWDDYDNSIQLNERQIDHQKHLSENFDGKLKKSDIDKQLDRVHIREENILDSRWVTDQKKKIVMQNELKRKMAEMLFNKGTSQLAKDHSKSDATKTLAMQLIKLKEMAKGLKKAKEDDERVE